VFFLDDVFITMTFRCCSTLTGLDLFICVVQDELVPASDETCPALPIPSRQPTSYYPPMSSGKSGKIYSSKKSSKATSLHGKSGKGGSGKSGKSKSSNGGYRNLQAVRTARVAGMNESSRERHATITKKYHT
jgi:hypothetical protein